MKRALHQDLLQGNQNLASIIKLQRIKINGLKFKLNYYRNSQITNFDNPYAITLKRNQSKSQDLGKANKIKDHDD